jgi:ElaB/YqjD/DUF883 family membrane-anchored ribosome-binding protein
MPDDRITASGEALQADLAQLREDVISLTKAVGNLVGGTGNTAWEQVRETGERLQHRVAKTASEAGEVYDSSLTSLSQQITARPLTAILLAFGAGLVLGKIADRA